MKPTLLIAVLALVPRLALADQPPAGAPATAEPEMSIDPPPGSPAASADTGPKAEVPTDAAPPATAKTWFAIGLAPGTNTETSGKPGFELVGGVDYKLGPGRLLGEARFVYSSLDHTLTGSSNAGNVTISLGYRFVF